MKKKKKTPEQIALEKKYEQQYKDYYKSLLFTIKQNFGESNKKRIAKRLVEDLLKEIR